MPAVLAQLLGRVPLYASVCAASVVLIATVQAAEGDDPLPLDAASCAALNAAAQRGGGQFPMGRAACGLVTAPRIGTAPPLAHARQLQLYAPAAELAASVPAAPPVQPPAPIAKPRKSLTRAKQGRLPAAIARAVELAPEIDRIAASNQLDPLLLHAMARIESAHNPAAVSHAGALGLMQVMPATGARFGVAKASELHSVPINLEVSARYLKTLKRRFPGDLQLVLAAYNAGEGAVERHGRRIPPYAETQAYVRKVLAEYALLRDALTRGSGRQP